LVNIAEAVGKVSGFAFRTRLAGNSAKFLAKRGVIDKSLEKRIVLLSNRAGKMLHRFMHCNCIRARWFVAETEAVVRDLENAFAAQGHQVELKKWQQQ
jgi:hypothetical protein